MRIIKGTGFCSTPRAIVFYATYRSIMVSIEEEDFGVLIGYDPSCLVHAMKDSHWDVELWARQVPENLRSVCRDGLEVSIPDGGASSSTSSAGLTFRSAKN